MLKIFADTLEKHGSAVISAEESIAVTVIRVHVRAAVAWAVAVTLVAAVTLIATVSRKATVIARARGAAILAARKITPCHAEGIF